MQLILNPVETYVYNASQIKNWFRRNIDAFDSTEMNKAVRKLMAVNLITVDESGYIHSVNLNEVFDIEVITTGSWQP